MSQTSLFAYGSLLVPVVRRRIIGRDVKTVVARVLDHERRSIRGEIYPALRPRPGAEVEGKLLRIGVSDLPRLDAYEGEMYVRRLVTVVLPDGTREEAHTYLIAPEFEDRLSDEEWSLAEYQKQA
jgi:gamma-glutamylcyclotransferase (GGCT)/AIG2-like uncharacterized protein YtfP